MLGMARGGAADFAEMLEVVDGDLGITRQPEQRIQQHRAVAGRQHEAVAVGPARLGGVELQEPGKEDGGDIGHAHRQARMARFCGFHRIHGKHADGVGEAAHSVLVRNGLIGQGHVGFPAYMVGALSERLALPSRAGTCWKRVSVDPISGPNAAGPKLHWIQGFLLRPCPYNPPIAR